MVIEVFKTTGKGINDFVSDMKEWRYG